MSTNNSGLDITSRTTVVGSINDEAYEGAVVARFNTNGGGKSECQFERLPRRFNPGTIGTHT